MGLLPGEKEAILLSAESLSESADAHPLSRWIGGILLPLAPCTAGVVFAIRAAVIWSNLPTLHAVFVPAGISICLFAMTVFMHAHFFWTPHPKWHILGWLGKNASAAVIVAVLLFALYQSFANL